MLIRLFFVMITRLLRIETNRNISRQTVPEQLLSKQPRKCGCCAESIKCDCCAENIPRSTSQNLNGTRK